MYESRKPIWALVSLLLFGLTVGMAHADVGSTDVMSPDPLTQPVTESLTDFGSDAVLTADTESPDAAANCESDTAVTDLLGIETALSASVAASGWSWTCGPCSVSACRNLPVGNPCGFNRWCVVSISCSTIPLTEKCVCGTDHF